MGIAETPTPPKQMKSTHDRMLPTAMTYTGNVVRTDHVSGHAPVRVARVALLTPFANVSGRRTCARHRARWPPRARARRQRRHGKVHVPQKPVAQPRMARAPAVPPIHHPLDTVLPHAHVVVLLVVEQREGDDGDHHDEHGHVTAYQSVPSGAQSCTRRGRWIGTRRSVGVQRE